MSQPPYTPPPASPQQQPQYQSQPNWNFNYSQNNPNPPSTSGKLVLIGAILVVVLIGLFTILPALSGSLGGQGQLVGRWQQTSNGGVAGFGSEVGTVIEFYPNGEANLVKYASKYTLPANRKMTLSLGAFTASYTYAISGNKLTITADLDNLIYEYKRV